MLVLRGLGDMSLWSFKRKFFCSPTRVLFLQNFYYSAMPSSWLRNNQKHFCGGALLLRGPRPRLERGAGVHRHCFALTFVRQAR